MMILGFAGIGFLAHRRARKAKNEIRNDAVAEAAAA